MIANLETSIGPGLAILIAAGNTAEAFGARWIYYRVSRARRLLHFYAAPVSFIVAATFATMLSATMGALVLWLFNGLPSSNVDDIWLTWWTGDALGALLLTPLILGFNTCFQRKKFSTSRLVNLVTVGLPAIFISYIVFSSNTGAAWLFAVFPIVLLSARLVREAELRLITFAIAFCAVWFAAQNLGPFNGSETNQNLIHLQFFLASLALTSLMIEGFKKAGSLKPTALALCAAGFYRACCSTRSTGMSKRKTIAGSLSWLSMPKIAFVQICAGTRKFCCQVSDFLPRLNPSKSLSGRLS